MRKFRIVPVLLALDAAVAICLAQGRVKAGLSEPAPEELLRRFEEADRRTVRLPPAAFPQLPRAVAAELERRGCTVPQSSYTDEPHNVIRGEFARRGQTDWAVLCSVKGVSTILVFWNGSSKSPAGIAPAPDLGFLQSDVGDRINYSRGISAVGREFIIRHYEAYGGTAPPPIGHQGIDDAFIEKGSVTWYFHDGRWLRLTGAD